MRGVNYRFVVQVKRVWSKFEKPNLGRILREVPRGTFGRGLKFSLCFGYKS